MTPVKELLLSLQDEKYRKFSLSLLPGVDGVIGVRLPELRKIAKKEALKDWKAAFENLTDDSFEERMLKGMVLGYARVPFEETRPYIEKFLPSVNCWSICDAFCAGLKSIKKSPENGWKFIFALASDKREFYARCGVVLAMSHFVSEPWLDNVFKAVISVTNTDYYAYVAQGWAVSVCAAKFPNETLEFLKSAPLSDAAFQKSLQKIAESKRIPDSYKTLCRALKKTAHAKM